MQRFIIISFLCIQFTVKSQLVKNNADSLLLYEYAFFNCPDDTTRQEILVKKINYYIRNNANDKEVFSDLKRVDINKLKNNIFKENFLWNAGIISYLNNETEYCRRFVMAYGRLKSDSTITHGIMIILANKYSDTALVNKTINRFYLKDSLIKSLNCFTDITAYGRKHLGFYIISSAIIPGSGTIMNGAVIKGLISLALCAGSVYGVYTLIHYSLYANALFWGTGVGLKFYNGNLKLTEKVFNQKEQKQQKKLANACELNLEKLLIRYPLFYR